MAPEPGLTTRAGSIPGPVILELSRAGIAISGFFLGCFCMFKTESICMRPPHDCFDESCCASVFAWTFKSTESCCAPVFRCDNQQDLACMQSGLIRLIYKQQIRLMVIMSIPLKVAQHYALHANTHNLHAPDTSCCHHVHTTSDICMGTRSLSLSSCPFHVKLHNTSLYEQTRTICRRRILLAVIMSTPLLTSA